MSIGAFWDLIILNPMINVMVILSELFFDNFGLTIIVLTVAVNLIMYPLTQKQLKASKAMQEVQSQVAELRKKYAKDKQKLAQEQMRLFRESGVSYAGCILPMLVQMPVWIVLYQSIIRVLAVAPEDFLGLSQRLFNSWTSVFSLVPLEHSFFFGLLNLSMPNPVLAVLAGLSMWVQQKMTTPQTTDPQQQAQSQMMQWMMPMMFGFLGLSFPAGLTLYWVTSTIIRIVLQYFATGWGSLVPMGLGKRETNKDNKGRARQKKELTEEDTKADIIIEPSVAQEEGSDYGERRDKRQDSRRSYPTSIRTTRRRPGGGGSNRRKRR